MTVDPRIEKLYLEWARQGRTDEQRWAVMNFLTGTGLRIRDVLAEESLLGYDRGERMMVIEYLKLLDAMRKRPRAAHMSPEPTDTAFADGWEQAINTMKGETKNLME